ncbi:tumor necrosis factor alpha-induced protein 3 isoform X2 [Polypterus senegalus]|uniref:tumor necrosis factor alpha-induced protein 3 isoform X2 n=1 Tax=Polypterus senegalus TaxID=55291 RepID=UPI0019651F3E|nr:tumor necrosis factor alpha-induced protein 3 isoform X2 [Polypterus senegalus]
MPRYTSAEIYRLTFTCPYQFFNLQKMSGQQNLLPQFLFITNLLKAVKIRERVADDVVKSSSTNGIIPYLKSMHRCTLQMFRISQFTVQFREVIQNALLDQSMRVSLEEEKKLNWCKEVKKLVPLRTNGDGNCLLHAASQYMLGVQDTDLVLRKALYSALRETDAHNFKMRYQLACMQSQAFTETGLCYNTMNWEDEWEKIIKMASPTSSHSGLQYDSLEDIHILVLANILRRPIIVIADQVLKSMKSGTAFSPLNVGGIYLPLAWRPHQCYRYPIVLGYDSQHFAPLITMKDSSAEIRAVPLAYEGKGRFEDLKVHFLKGSEDKNDLLKEYLNLVEIPIQRFGSDITHIIMAARLDEGNLPEDMDLMEDYLQVVNHEYKHWQEKSKSCRQSGYNEPEQFSLSQLSLIEIKCATKRCPFYISVDTRPYCHECFEKRMNAKPEMKPQSQIPLLGAEHHKLTRAGSSNPRDCVPLRTSNEKSVTSPRCAPPTAPSLNLFSETHAMKCKTPECLFTLNVQHNGLCEHCFIARQSNQIPDVESKRNPEFGKCLNEPQLPLQLWHKQNEDSPTISEDTKCGVCHQNVSRTFNGLCNLCMQRSCNEKSILSKYQRNSPWPSQPVGSRQWLWFDPEESVLPSQSQEISEGTPCRKQGCPFYGTLQKLGFCTICFFEYQNMQRSEDASLAHRRLSPRNVLSSAEAVFQNTSKCLSHHCTNLGNSIFEGYCEKCYLKQQNQRYVDARRTAEHTPPTRHETTPPRFQQSHLITSPIQCFTNNCSNCVSVWKEYCSECQKNGVQTNRRIQTVGETAKPKCRTLGCDHYANQEKQGFCNECDLFRQIYKN